MATIIRLLLLSGLMLSTTGKDMTRPSDETEFLVQPDNMTIPEGNIAVMKCKVLTPVQRCRWYYLEEGFNFFDEVANPILAKDFQPKNPQDCSIKFQKVKKLQEGQWMCQALQVNRARFIISRPVSLDVITEDEAEAFEGRMRQMMEREKKEILRRENEVREREEKERAEEENKKDAEFQMTEDNYIQTTSLGSQAMLNCKVMKPLKSCMWTMPHGNMLEYDSDFPTNTSNHGILNYVMEGNMKSGNCSLLIRNVRVEDEGNWRCSVEVKNPKTNLTRMSHGPLIHLHILEYDHSKGGMNEPVSYISEPATLSTTTFLFILLTLLLLVVVVILCYYLCKKLSAHRDETKNILSNYSVSPNDYSQRWMNKMNLSLEPPQLIDTFKGRELPIHYTDLDHYSQYLDMRGSGIGTDEYITMSNSDEKMTPRFEKSMSMASTLTMGRSRTTSCATTTSNVSSGSSGSNMSQNGHNHTFDNLLFIAENKEGRPFSVYSSGHLYEEIPDAKCVDINKHPILVQSPLYTNLTEDQEGYMIPSSKTEKTTQTTQTPPEVPPPNKQPANKEAEETKLEEPINKAPPYCCVGNAEVLTPTTVINLEYDVSSRQAFNYDVPRPHSQPSEENSEDYDVPKPTTVTTMLDESAQPIVNISLSSIPGVIV